MASDLLLQATPELLEGWRKPCLDHRDGYEVIVLVVRALGNRALCLDLAAGDQRVMALSDLFLDLAREESRDRVARLLAQRRRGPGRHEIDHEYAKALIRRARQVFHG